MNLPIFDQFIPGIQETNRTLENELSNIRSILTLNQENESNSSKRAFHYSINPYFEAQFEEIDLFFLFKVKIDQILERTFSRVSFLFLVQSKD